MRWDYPPLDINPLLLLLLLLQAGLEIKPSKGRKNDLPEVIVPLHIFPLCKHGDYYKYLGKLIIPLWRRQKTN